MSPVRVSLINAIVTCMQLAGDWDNQPPSKKITYVLGIVGIDLSETNTSSKTIL